MRLCETCYAPMDCDEIYTSCVALPCEECGGYDARFNVVGSNSKVHHYPGVPNGLWQIEHGQFAY